MPLNPRPHIPPRRPDLGASARCKPAAQVGAHCRCGVCQTSAYLLQTLCSKCLWVPSTPQSKHISTGRNPVHCMNILTGSDASAPNPGHGCRYVIARGQLLKTPQWVRGSTFEEGPGIRPHKLQ